MDFPADKPPVAKSSRLAWLGRRVSHPGRSRLERFPDKRPDRLLRFYQGQDEILVVTHECESARAGFEGTLKPEKLLEEPGAIGGT